LNRLALRAAPDLMPAAGAAGPCPGIALPTEVGQWHRQFPNTDWWSEKFTQMACTLQQIATEIEKQPARYTKHSCARQNKTTGLNSFWVCLPVDTHRNDPDLTAIVAFYVQAYNCAGRERRTLLTAFLRDAQAFRIWTL
jgi:hypothetical protein